jgi:tripartite ATP-independent transporter DctM subunit
MVGGMVTPTEAGVLAAIWSLIVGFVYGDFSFKQIPNVLYKSFLSSAHIMFLIALGSLMGWIISTDGTSETLAAKLVSLTQNKYIVLVLINITALIVGCVLEPTPALLVCFPVFEPLITSLGINRIHFGVIMCLAVEIGQLTPPVGLGLYVMSSICGVDIMTLFRQVLPFLAILIIGLLVITFVPWLSLWLPNFLMP